MSLEFADLLLEDSNKTLLTQSCLPNLLELSLAVNLGLNEVLLGLGLLEGIGLEGCFVSCIAL